MGDWLVEIGTEIENGERGWEVVDWLVERVAEGEDGEGGGEVVHGVVEHAQFCER